MSTTIEHVAQALSLDVVTEHGATTIPLPRVAYTEEYVTLAYVDEMDVEDSSLIGERWLGSWSIGPRADADLDAVLAWIARTIRRPDRTLGCRATYGHRITLG